MKYGDPNELLFLGGPQERVCPRKSHTLPVNSHVLLIKGDQHTAEAIASDENRLGRIVR